MLLFKISKEGRSAILFGTIHSCNWKFVPEPIKQIVLSADILIGEHGSVSNKTKEKFNFFKQDKLEKSLFHIFAPESKEIIYNAFKNSTNREISTIDPDLLTDVGLVYYINCLAYYNGIDNTLDRKFKNNNKQLFYLESSEEIFEQYFKKVNFYSIAEASINLYQSEALGQVSLDNIESLKKLDPLLWCYLNDQIFKSILDGLSEEKNKWMFEDRNLKWLPVIQKYINDYQKANFCFGSGHLFGEKGLIRLLLNLGFSIEKYDNEGNLNSFTLNDLEIIEAESICHEMKYRFDQNKFNNLTAEQEQFVKAWAYRNDDKELLAILTKYETEQKLEQVEAIGQI